MNSDSSVGIITGLRAGQPSDRGLIPVRAGDFALLKITNSAANSSSYPRMQEAVSPEEKRPGRECDHSSSSEAEIRVRGSIPPLLCAFIASTGTTCHAD